MQVSQIMQKIDWEQAVAKFPEANFLQSWQWGTFQESLGKKVIRVLATVESESAVAQLVIEHAKRGRYVALAGGPLINWQSTKFVAEFFQALSEIAVHEKCVFIRFRPQELEKNISTDTVKMVGAHVAPMHLTADLTLQLDLSKTDEQLLAEMRKNTRYEIRKSEKLEITTKVSTQPEEMQKFYDEQLAVARRHGFVPFGREFLEKQFQAFVADDAVVLIHSFAGEVLLASAFIIFYNREAVYHYGVSTEANAKLPGSYAVQWRAIQEAKKRNCTKYNFWGIAPEDSKGHRFAGVSLFKRGFGGVEVQYLPAHDIPLTARYWITWLFELLRKKMRRL